MNYKYMVLAIFNLLIIGTNVFPAARPNRDDVELRHQLDLAKALSLSIQADAEDKAKRQLEIDTKRAIAASLAPAKRAERPKVEHPKAEAIKFKILPCLRQAGLDCMYHALKNGNYILKFTQGILDEKSCKEHLITSDSRIFPLELWRIKVNAKFPGRRTNLDALEGLYIAKDILKLEPKEDITFIPDLFDSKQAAIERDHNLKAAVREFRTLRNKSHVFILGNMSLSHPSHNWSLGSCSCS